MSNKVGGLPTKGSNSGICDWPWNNIGFTHYALLQFLRFTPPYNATIDVANRKKFSTFYSDVGFLQLITVRKSGQLA